MSRKLVFTSIGKDVGGCSTYEEVVEYSNLDYEVSIKDVVVEGTNIKVPNMKVICSKDEVIASCKSKYKLILNTDAFKTLDNISNVGKFKWCRAFRTSDHDSYIIGKIDKLFNHTFEPITTCKNSITFYVILTNSYNTKTAQSISITPVKESTILPLHNIGRHNSRHTSKAVTTDNSLEIYNTIMDSIGDILDFYNRMITKSLTKLELYRLVSTVHLGDRVPNYIEAYNNNRLSDSIALNNYIDLFENRSKGIVSKMGIKELILNEISSIVKEVEDTSTGGIVNVFNWYYITCKRHDDSYEYPTEYVRFNKELNSKFKIDLITKLYEKYLEKII